MAPFKQVRVPAHLRDPSYTTGRPSLYKPEYCDMVVEAMHKEGISLTAFAGLIGVSAETVYAWIRRIPEFSDAVSRARPGRVLFLERKLMRSRKGAETTAAIFALKNAAPAEWKDVRTTLHQPVFDVKKLTDAQLNAIASGVAPSDVGVIDGECERIGER
jgi:transposase